MSVDPADDHELAQIASEIGAGVLSGDLRFFFETDRLSVETLCSNRDNVT